MRRTSSMFDEVERGDLLGYQVPIADPVPTDLRLQITLAYASPVDPTQPTEYTSASLELVLRPNHRVHSFRAPAGVSERSRTLDIRGDEARALLAQGVRVPGSQGDDLAGGDEHDVLLRVGVLGGEVEEPWLGQFLTGPVVGAAAAVQQDRGTLARRPGRRRRPGAR